MKTYFITGANRGIGLAFCEYLLANENEVWASSRVHSNRNYLNKLKEKYADHLNLLDLDITDESGIALVKDYLHGIGIDVLLNIAGVFDLPGKSFETEFSPWETMFRVNTIGPALLAEALLPNLKRAESAKVINISSDMGSIELNSNAIYTPYRVTKAALNAISKSYAIKWQTHGITVISMNPGWVRTDMGGPNGQLSPLESVEMMYQVIQNIDLNDSGKFFSYEKEELPW